MDPQAKKLALRALNYGLHVLTANDGDGRTPLDLCRAGRATAADPSGHDAVDALLTAASR